MGLGVASVLTAIATCSASCIALYFPKATKAPVQQHASSASVPTAAPMAKPGPGPTASSGPPRLLRVLRERVVGASVGASVTGVGPGVGEAVMGVGCGVGGSVIEVGSGVGAAVGKGVGCGVGDAVGEVGAGVGAAVGKGVSGVGPGVGESVTGVGDPVGAA